MGEGRRLTISRSERFLGSYSYGNGGRAETELVEEDVWSAVDEDMSDRPDRDWTARVAAESGVVRNGGRAGFAPNGLSLAFHDPSPASSRIVHQGRGNDPPPVSPLGRSHMARSAPVNVPDWSKILRVDSVDSLHGDDSDLVDDDVDEMMVPPHEWAARNRNAGGTSVFEGVDRTLKGRDMRRVRDAVWSQTGFDG